MTSPRPRAYQSELRQRQAAETRQRIVAAAASLFSELGYPGTTLAKIAERAQVSVETVQKNGPKAALIRAAVEYTSFGIEGDRDVRDLDVGRAFLALTRPEQVAPLAAATMRTVNAGSAGVWVALTCAAHSDPELRETFVEFLVAIRRQNERMLGVLRDRGWLRTDLGFDQIVDTWIVLSSVETYVRLRASGRSDDEYAAWLERTAAEMLLGRRTTESTIR
ncbi:MAG TPA: TetR family transcriptional regulator [Ramlibacter sp.]|uniref:TetR/AcrR family transcriptional regulator n=1 Tax=Ramlibacter sp. TaxID=1917967 RepID=UPI002D7F1719|nr:TetR family transcriptional regulator [Ramlibacter sp.]HET8746490.1 TetR family transcriptional regulator [Ramlibacter sp.]